MLAASNGSPGSIRDGPSPSRKILDWLRQAPGRLLAWLVFEPQSRIQIEQLARRIRDYGRMNGMTSRPVLIRVPEMAARFRESPRNVRESLKLLEAQGIAERAYSKDHWELSEQLEAPSLKAYNSPIISRPYPKMLPDPPPGWSELQKRAREAQTAQELSAIIDEMNRLLSNYEKATDNKDSANELPARKDKDDDQSTCGQRPPK